MGNRLAEFGIQAANTAAGGIFGIAMQGINDKRQIEQQKKLQAMQLEGQKEMTEYQRQKQLQMWRDTNYSAQMGELKKAGLNPGLIYGMSGGGGTTTGGGAASGPSGGNAPTGGGEIQAMMGMGIQSALLEAQRRNIEANTEKTKVETAKTSGVDTQKVQTEILDLTQGIVNKKAQEAMTRVQTKIAGIEETLKERTLEDSVRAVGWQAEKIMQEMEQARFETNIAEDTWRDKVSMVKAELMGIWLKNALTKSQTIKTVTEIQDIIRQGIQRWKALDIAGQNAQTQDNRQRQDAWLNDVQKSTQIPMDILKEALDGILKPGTKITHNKQYNSEINY